MRRRPSILRSPVGDTCCRCSDRRSRARRRRCIGRVRRAPHLWIRATDKAVATAWTVGVPDAWPNAAPSAVGRSDRSTMRVPYGHQLAEQLAEAAEKAARGAGWRWNARIAPCRLGSSVKVEPWQEPASWRLAWAFGQRAIPTSGVVSRHTIRGATAWTARPIFPHSHQQTHWSVVILGSAKRRGSGRRRS